MREFFLLISMISLNFHNGDLSLLFVLVLVGRQPTPGHNREYNLRSSRIFILYK